MIHGLTNQFLYSAFKLSATFTKAGEREIRIIGTAFFVMVSGAIFAVTNRHNLDIAYKDKKYTGYRLTAFDLTGRFGDDTLSENVQVLEPWDIRFHPNAVNDVAVIANLRFAGVGKGNIVLNHFINEGMIAGLNDFANDLSVCDFVAFPGYPIWHDQVESRPILRAGTIASDPRQSYHFQRSDGTDCGDCVGYEAFSSGGSSGSPVFALQKGIKPGAGLKFDSYRDAKLIGINGGHVPSSESSHSGISFFYKSTLIFDLTNK